MSRVLELWEEFILVRDRKDSLCTAVCRSGEWKCAECRALIAFRDELYKDRTLSERLRALAEEAGWKPDPWGTPEDDALITLIENLNKRGL